ncbi:hypothetical protein B5X24_HaOG202847 [Helicoverpa armigera]|nr:hypothetical protein B5X24_HaOG202847 [Helicoverpa armigera]
MWSKNAVNATRLSSVVNKRWKSHIQAAAGQSYLKNPGTEPLKQTTLGDVIAKSVNKYPDRVAIRSVHEDVTITYAELLRQADSLACALRAQGLKKGDRLGLWSYNCSSWLVALVAASRAGLISVLLNPIYENRELSFCIKKTGIKSLLIGDKTQRKNYYESLSQMIPELENSKPFSLQSSEFPTLNSVISIGKDHLAGTTSFNSLVSGSGSQISRYTFENKPSDGTLILLTSGTTGDPKAALNSHLGVVNNTYFIGKRNILDQAHQTVLVQAPFFHALGCIVTSLSGLQHGSTLVLPAPFYNVNDNLNAMLAEKCTIVTGTPTMYVDMLARLKSLGATPSGLRVAMAAGAPCSPQLIRDMQTELKAEAVTCLYGLSETVACNFQSVPGDSTDVVAETVGCLHDHNEAKVVDDNGEMVPFGKPGELLVRGYNNMIGYWDEPKKTSETINKDGWLYTGDKFTISEDGYGRVVGRLKDIIVRGGENIAPKEIEDWLNTHPDIKDSQVVGVTDERLGEDLCAVLRVKEGATVTIDDIKKHCEGRLARFKIPRLMKVIDEFPKTASGKIQKHRIKDLIESGKL